jgi:Na+-transporting NADH:ubiquinone oxidoreductase subunit A
MSDTIKIRKGLNIKLAGAPEPRLCDGFQATSYALRPDDFPGLVPRVLVHEGDVVQAGTALFCDKNRPRVLFTSPVSGRVEAVVRGPRRKLLAVVVSGDDRGKSESFPVADPLALSRDEVCDVLLRSGLWPSLIQRPYGIIAQPGDVPRDIFISAFDSAPLAPAHAFVLKDEAADFQAGVHALSRLTSGKVHLGLPAGRPDYAFLGAIQGLTCHYFQGPHPAGNVGIQIHHIAPVNKGEVVWTVHPQEVVLMGRLFLRGVCDFSLLLAVTGAEAPVTPAYYRVIRGSSVRWLTARSADGAPRRYISGNVLTGNRLDADGFLGYYDHQITVLPEGGEPEFLGWMMPGMNKFSFWKMFPAFLMPGKQYRPDTRLNGGHRAFVFSGVYEKVVPMDLLPVHLLKASLAGNVELMEQLGIYEVIEEDLALCEVICPSKMEVQKMLRQGIDLMIREMS